MCSGHDLKMVVSLGFTPLANALLTKDQLNEPEEKFPLDLVFCQDCKLVQIVETVPAEKLFKQYVYMSSISNTMLESSRLLTERLIQERNPKTVLEIGSNDGYLLKNYVKAGIKVVGVEPAENIAEIARKNGVYTITGFWNLEASKKLRGEDWHFNTGRDFRVDIVHANNVLAHVEHLHSVIAGIENILANDGVCVVETHYVRDLIEQTQFDCIYHEHLCYYSAHSLEHLFKMHGMVLVDIERIPMHGGSLRAYFQRSNGPKSYLKADKVHDFLLEESVEGLTEETAYRTLGKNLILLREKLNDLIRDLKREGKTIAGYGATAKSTTLLNFFWLGDEQLSCILDATPLKQGRFSPGTHLSIVSPEVLKDEPKWYVNYPDYLLLLAWNFADEIIQKESAYRERGGKFIIPLPEVKIV